MKISGDLKNFGNKIDKLVNESIKKIVDKKGDEEIRKLEARDKKRKRFKPNQYIKIYDSKKKILTIKKKEGK